MIKNILHTALLVMGLVIGFSSGVRAEDVHARDVHRGFTWHHPRIAGQHVAERHHDANVPRIHAVQRTQVVVNHRTFFHNRPHGYWHPRYNYYHHQYHFYPYVYVTPTVYLSSGYIPIDYGGQSYYYDQGVFYQNADDGQGYAAVPPPVGAILKTLPSGAVQVVIQNEIYFVYNDVYYKPVPDGFQVTEPPR